MSYLFIHSYIGTRGAELLGLGDFWPIHGSQEPLTDFHGNEAKVFFSNFLFKTANSQNFFTKISGIGPWVGRIDSCEGHWCGSTYMVMRLSDISSKTVKKCNF
jgi:hypothetical protein